MALTLTRLTAKAILAVLGTSRLTPVPRAVAISMAFKAGALIWSRAKGIYTFFLTQGQAGL